jgi:hypothetical protein
MRPAPEDRKNSPILVNVAQMVAKTIAKMSKLKLTAQNSYITLLLNAKKVQQTMF